MYRVVFMIIIGLTDTPVLPCVGLEHASRSIVHQQNHPPLRDATRQLRGPGSRDSGSLAASSEVSSPLFFISRTNLVPDDMVSELFSSNKM